MCTRVPIKANLVSNSCTTLPIWANTNLKIMQHIEANLIATPELRCLPDSNTLCTLESMQAKLDSK
jgi:hypothetical protein